MENQDVIVIGAGGGGAVIAKELGEMGLKVLVLEAGPWYGNKKWPNPNIQPGAKTSSNSDDLDVILYKKLLNKYEANMDDLVSGRFRWGPADRSRSPWFRQMPQKQIIWQSCGVGGTTQHYTANSPRAFPLAVDNIWPLSYQELVPYYEKVETTLPVNFAPTTAKEELFYYGAKKAGWQLIPTLDVTIPGFRPQPNAILPPNENLTNLNVSLEQLSWMKGCTLAGHCINGCPHGPSVDSIAKRSTNVSYVPLALRTGNVTIRPNAFTMKIITDTPSSSEGLHAIGVQIRDTWTGVQEELKAKVVVMAAGSIESPRLWLNSALPQNPWVGRGLTNHYMDWVSGIFDEKDLHSILGERYINPFVGHTSGARLDYPGLGSLQSVGMSPGLTASLSYGISESGSYFLHPPNPHDLWDTRGHIVGHKLREVMADYRRTLNILIITDDEVDPRNGITLHPSISDEHGFVPLVKYTPTEQSRRKRSQLFKIAADILRKAGAKKVIWSDWPAGVMIHMGSTMRMGFVVNQDCEAYQVKRLYISDNSVHYNSLGGSNPTLTTQALATRTAEKLFKKYFN
ncbi:GMC family oxidoreductase N-terminal domain-containing protein [Peribacillus asahii]|uniref:GMC family oxidoreductase N-terminal domain-containing protein n=1 Tax=Peribacillus asahii TaxID=228899 RepID=UPI00207AE979|nr:GMC family oxidoreductase N-terminal domain-containing protein [Peribacillus asahii]USK72295.1 GMC family oxidoreductase N-terminal domain-containing protein [Peribacillus asahii]